MYAHSRVSCPRSCGPRAALVVLPVLAACSAVASASGPVQTTYSGILVDDYCFSLSRMGVPVLDGSNVITGPREHTLHCLRDPPQCRRGFFLAINRGAVGASDYGIKFKLDDASHARVLELLDSFPRGHERDYARDGFYVTAEGAHHGDGILRGASFRVCSGGEVACDGVCNVTNGTCDTPLFDGVELPLDGLVVAHASLMLLSWGFLLPLGTLWARNLRKSGKKVGGVPAWFGGHRLMQSVGVALQLAGFVCIFLFKRGGHFSLHHEVVGLVVVLLGTMQPLNAQLRHVRLVGHPGGPGPLRRAWEVLHKGSGYAAVLLGMFNVVLGIVHASNLGFAGGLVPAAGVAAGLSLGTQVAAGVLLEIRRSLGLPDIFEPEEAKAEEVA